MCWCCETLSECADTDGDGIRDDQCVSWQCVNGVCEGVDIIFADMGGQFGSCLVDGITDGSDRFHAMNCFADTDPNQVPGYSCEDNPPHALNVDAGGPLGVCASDGVCDANDAFHALAALGNSSMCTCPANDTPPVGQAAPFMAATATLALRSSHDAITAGDTVSIDVYLRSPMDDLRGYQLHLDVRGGFTGALRLIDISFDQGGPLGNNAWRAFNAATGQMTAGLDGPGVATKGDVYLATFTYRATDDARGLFRVDVLHNYYDAGQRTYLFPTPMNGGIHIEPVSPAHILVDG